MTPEEQTPPSLTVSEEVSEVAFYFYANLDAVPLR
jgi:hypothetical protein